MSTPRRPAPRSIGTPTMPTSRGLAGWWLFTRLIVIEATPGLSTKVAGRDHLAQQRRCGETRVLELVEQDVSDVQRCVQADEVQQREWAHRVAGAEHHPNIDVLLRGKALLEHPHRLREVRNQ